MSADCDAGGIRLDAHSGNAAGTNTVIAFDEFRLGNSFGDVTPVPEPMTIALGSLGGLMLLALRRRKQDIFFKQQKGGGFSAFIHFLIGRISHALALDALISERLEPWFYLAIGSETTGSL